MRRRLEVLNSFVRFCLIIVLVLLYHAIILSIFAFALVFMVQALEAWWDKPESKTVFFAGVAGFIALVMFVVMVEETPLPYDGISLKADFAPQMYEFVCDIAKTVNAKMVDSIMIVPGLDLGVYQRVRLITAALHSERVLVMGMMALYYLSESQLQSVLAHEFAHFRHKDTAVQNLVTRTQWSFLNLSQLYQGTDSNKSLFGGWAVAILLLPYVLIVQIIKQLSSVSFSYLRCEELEADNVAIATYGKRLFQNALTGIYVEVFLFQNKIKHCLDECLYFDDGIDDLYSEYKSLSDSIDQSVRAEIQEMLMNCGEKKDSTHPPLHARLQFAENCRPENEETSKSRSRPAFCLLDQSMNLEEHLTRRYKRSLGIVDATSSKEEVVSSGAVTANQSEIKTKELFATLAIIAALIALVCYVVVIIVRADKLLEVISAILGIYIASQIMKSGSRN